MTTRERPGIDDEDRPGDEHTRRWCLGCGDEIDLETDRARWVDDVGMCAGCVAREARIRLLQWAVMAGADQMGLAIVATLLTALDEAALEAAVVEMQHDRRGLRLDEVIERATRPVRAVPVPPPTTTIEHVTADERYIGRDFARALAELDESLRLAESAKARGES